MWDLSCPDWRDRIQSQRPLIRDYPLDWVAADKAVALFDRLRLADVPGCPTMAEAAGDWFREIVRALFGSWDSAKKVRYIREIFVLVPKKNSKTTYSAALMLVALLRNQRPGARFLLVAPSHDVTELAFNQAAGAVRLDPEIEAIIHIIDHQKTLKHRTTGATLEIMSFDPKVLTGQKPTGFMMDELHVVSDRPGAASAVGQLRGGMISQPEAFGVFTTTQSEKPPSGVFDAELKSARAIRDGRAKGRTLPVLYEFPEAIAKDEAKWSDPEYWPMVLPNLGRPVTIDRLMEDFHGAKAKGTAEFTRWASQHLNIEIGLGLIQNNWAGAEFWLKGAEDRLTLPDIVDRCDVLTAGIDGGGADDLLGMAVVGREKTTRRWLGWSHAWVHRVALDRRKKNIPVYEDFVSDGDLTVVDAYPEDLDGVTGVLDELLQSGKLAAVGLDAIGLRQAVDALAEVGVSQEAGNLVAIRQGIGLAGAGKALERKLIDGTFRHCGQRLLNWAVGNVMIKPTATAFLFDKEKSGYGKIDPFMALLDAVELMSTNPDTTGTKRSVYEERDGFLIL